MATAVCVFASRSRHTRFSRDWSSDVCSSDLPNTYALVNEALGVYYQQRPAGQTWGRTAILIHVGNFVSDVIGCVAVGMSHGGTRSEERRVGEECGWRRAECRDQTSEWGEGVA